MPHTEPSHRPAWRRWLVLALAAVGVMALGVGLILLAVPAAQPSSVLLAVTVAWVPLLVVVPTLLWVDRHEPEPAWLLLVSFGWGVAVATSGALLLNTWGSDQLEDRGLDDAYTATFVAPLTEETLKCLGVVLALILARRRFDSVADGVVYAGLVAAGFAFTENVLYLARGYQTMGYTGFVGTFIVRCLASPFAHPIFTICFGLAVGVAVTTSRRWLWVVAPLAGWVLAMGLHALWNGSASFGGTWALLLLVAIQPVIFVGFVLLLFAIRQHEARRAAEYLRPYVDAGWFTRREADMIGNLTVRRLARVYAASFGAKVEMEAFQRAGGELADLRRELGRGTGMAQASAWERDALERSVWARQALNARIATAPRVYRWPLRH